MNRRLQKALAKVSRIPGLEARLTVAVESLVVRATAAQRAYRGFHWGDEASSIEVKKTADLQEGDVVWALGELADVAYETHKGREIYVWEHAFGSPRPVLASTKAGRLVVVGGSYRITERGIVG